VTNPKTQTKTKGEVTLNIRQGYVFSFEDAINLQPRSRLEIILTTLDFDDVITTLSKENEQHRGPTGYLVEHKFKALIAMRVYNMATFTELVERLTHDPVLRYNCGFDFGHLSILLLNLELKGIVQALPGNYYVKL
jgi:predicted Rossmann fold nucleotide-binding protein DprA/Smf involved in DNA uptake